MYFIHLNFLFIWEVKMFFVYILLMSKNEYLADLADLADIAKSLETFLIIVEKRFRYYA